MTKRKSKEDKRLRLILFNEKVRTQWQEEMVLKEVVDNLILSIEMVLDAIEEVDESVIMSEDEVRRCYIEILDALEYSVDISMGGRQAFMEGMDLKPDEFYFMKKGDI